MSFLLDTLIALTETFVRRIQGASREQIARIHERVAEGIRNGEFVAEDAFREYRDDATKLAAAYTRLPK